jgi:hypothetical protein
MDLNGVRFIYTQVHKTLIVNCCLQFITLVYEAEEVNKILLNCNLCFQKCFSLNPSEEDSRVLQLCLQVSMS